MRTAIQTVVMGLVTLTLLAGSAPAQRANALEEGAWALMFSAQGEFITVDSFDGGVALKRNFSPKGALRLSVATSVFDFNDENAEDTGTVTNDESGGGVSVSVLYQRYANPGADAIIYWALGPAADYDQETTATASGDTTSYTSERTSWGAGLDAVFGVEWFASRVISFHAEYLGDVRYARSTQTSERTYLGSTLQFESTSDQWSFDLTRGVRFGLSVYF